MPGRTLARLIFEDGFTELDAEDARDRGHRSHVYAELDDGALYQLTYYDLTRLAQDLEVDCGLGRRFLTEPGLIIIPEITLANMEAAARALAAEGFFERHVAPVPRSVP
ncbi:MAG: hypothetical protein ABIY55_31650 [Kofleriaceae bacterium]